MSSNTPRLTDPRRLAGLILGVVAVFAVVVAATLVAKSRTARVEVTGPATSSADLRIKEAELEAVAGRRGAALDRRARPPLPRRRGGERDRARRARGGRADDGGRPRARHVHEEPGAMSWRATLALAIVLWLVALATPADVPAQAPS